jgi:hypothetical protein
VFVVAATGVADGQVSFLFCSITREGGAAVADIDPLLLGNELGVMIMLAVQVVLAVIAVAVGCAGRRRWARVALLATLVLAAAACARTLYQCEQARESTRGRLEGRVIGPHLSTQRAENHLAWLEGRLWLSIGIAAATWLVGGILYFSGRRARSAEPDIAPDPAA